MKGNRTLTIICFMVLLFLGIYVAVFQRFLDEIAIDLSLTKVAMGLIVTIHFIGFFIGPLFAGEISDKYGRKIVIIGAMTTFLVGAVIMFLSINIYFVIAGAFLIGAGFGTLEGSITTLLTDSAPEDSNRIIGVSQIVFGVGAAAGPFIAIAFIYLFNRWQIFYILCVILLILLIMTFKKYPFQDYKLEEKIDGIITTRLLSQKVFILLFLSVAMYVGVEEGVAFWITSYIKQSNVPEYYPSLILSVFWGSMIFGRYIVSRFINKLNELIIGSSIISLGFLLAILFINNTTVHIITFFGLGFALSGIWPMLMALARLYFPKYSGTALGLMMSGCALGGVLIPFVMGYIGDVMNMEFALAFCTIPLIIITISQFIVKHAAAAAKEGFVVNI